MQSYATMNAMSKTYPEPIVGAFIINKENKLFLMKSHKWNDLYVVPGGHIELGETIVQALSREVQEETHLKIQNPIFLCLWEFIHGSEFHAKKHMLFLNYRVDTTSSDVTLNNEAQDFVWVGKDEVLNLPLEHYTRLTIEEFGEKIF